jgi:class I lanthipeptide synthase
VPLLTGGPAARAVAVIDEIAGALRGGGGSGPYLPMGDAGVALLFAYLAQWREDAGYEELASALVEQVASRYDGRLSLHFGLGIAWTVEHVGAFDDQGEAVAAVDRAVLEALEAYTGHYDLLGGLVGMGVYALEGLPRPSASAILERVVEILAERARRDEPAGLYWWTEPDFMLGQRHVSSPDGHKDLGVAHGNPGVIGLLAASLAAGVAPERCRALLGGAVGWLLAQALPPGPGARFPYWVAPGRPPIPARTAWCYGDAGIAAVLHAAGRVAAEPAWQRYALALARDVAARPLEQTGVADAGLCHGAAGLGHIFHRLHLATGDAQFRDAAVDWLVRAVEMQRPGEGIVGFRAQDPKPGGDAGFLTGVAGIALALLSAVSDVEPLWDRVFLMSC